MGGSEAMLKRLLFKFRDTYRDTRSRLGSLLKTRQKDEAWRLIHTIKGVSANLGMDKLYRATLALETRMKADEYETMQNEAGAFLDELEAVVKELGETDSAGSAKDSNAGTPRASPGDPQGESSGKTGPE